MDRLNGIADALIALAVLSLLAAVGPPILAFLLRTLHDAAGLLAEQPQAALALPLALLLSAVMLAPAYKKNLV